MCPMRIKPIQSTEDIASPAEFNREIVHKKNILQLVSNGPAVGQMCTYTLQPVHEPQTYLYERTCVSLTLR